MPGGDGDAAEGGEDGGGGDNGGGDGDLDDGPEVVASATFELLPPPPLPLPLPRLLVLVTELKDGGTDVAVAGVDKVGGTASAGTGATAAVVTAAEVVEAIMRCVLASAPTSATASAPSGRGRNSKAPGDKPKGAGINESSSDGNPVLPASPPPSLSLTAPRTSMARWRSANDACKLVSPSLANLI